LDTSLRCCSSTWGLRSAAAACAARAAATRLLTAFGSCWFVIRYSQFLSTALAREVMQSTPSVCPSVFHMNSCMRVGHDRSSQRIEGQDHTCRSRSTSRVKLRRSIRLQSKAVFFIARRYASTVLAVVVCLCVCLCVRLSFTSRYCTKTATDMITQTTPHDSQGL